MAVRLDGSPFIVISVIGQELVKLGRYGEALTVLQGAMRIGTTSPRLKGSILSSLATAHWGLGAVEKAIACMQQDLAISKSLGQYNIHLLNIGAFTFFEMNN